MQATLEIKHLLDRHVVHETLVHGEQRDGHVGDGQRRVLRLLEQLGHAGAAVELLARGLIQVGSKLCKRRQFAVLRQVGANTAGQVLDQLGLGRAADARNRDTGIDGGADTGVEQAGFQENLAVGDRNHVGRHEGRYVTGLRFNDGQRSQ